MELIKHLYPAYYSFPYVTPTHSTAYGFHPADEVDLGNPSAPRRYGHGSPHVSIDYVDDCLFASYEHGDFCVAYTYETAELVMLGDELVTLPFIRTVYRRDPRLRWSEI